MSNLPKRTKRCCYNCLYVTKSFSGPMWCTHKKIPVATGWTSADTEVAPTFLCHKFERAKPPKRKKHRCKYKAAWRALEKRVRNSAFRVRHSAFLDGFIEDIMASLLDDAKRKHKKGE